MELLDFRLRNFPKRHRHTVKVSSRAGEVHLSVLESISGLVCFNVKLNACV